MANTFTQIYIHNVFAVDFHKALISPTWEEELYKYLSGIVQNQDQKMLAVNGVTDHIHFLIGMKPTCRLSDLMREIKKSTNEFINNKKFTKNKFAWQEGYGSVSVSRGELDKVAKYVMNQKEHHKQKSFKEEYLQILKDNDIKYDDRYLFDWI